MTTSETKSETPIRKQSELTVPLDREAISAAARAAISDAIETYPDPTILSDANARAAIADRPTLVRCPEMCAPCACCGGDGMVSVETSAAWKAAKGAVKLDELDDPGTKK